MKKLVLLFSVMSVIIIMMVSTNSAVAQKSTAQVGDKNLTEVSKSAKIIASQLTALKNQIRDLERKNKTEIAGLERSTKILLHNPGRNQYLIEKNDLQVKKRQQKTDSLITVYEQKKSDLEDQLINFTVAAAGKDQQNSVTLKSRNVIALADAYLTVKYADRMTSSADNGKTIFADSALIENGWINETRVSISGPANFSKGFKLKGKGRQVIPIPGPGQYCVVFETEGRIQRLYTKFDGYHQQGLDTKTQRSYAFMAWLPSR